jgi:hypothetical protein
MKTSNAYLIFYDRIIDEDFPVDSDEEDEPLPAE